MVLEDEKQVGELEERAFLLWGYEVVEAEVLVGVVGVSFLEEGEATDVFSY